MGGESEQKTNGRRKRCALVGLGGVDVTRSSANEVGKEEQNVTEKTVRMDAGECKLRRGGKDQGRKEEVEKRYRKRK